MNWLVVSTLLQNIIRNGNLPLIGVKRKKHLKPPPSEGKVGCHGCSKKKKRFHGNQTIHPHPAIPSKKAHRGTSEEKNLIAMGQGDGCIAWNNLSIGDYFDTIQVYGNYDKPL